MKIYFIGLLAAIAFFCPPALAQGAIEKAGICPLDTPDCLIEQLEETTAVIEETHWRDSTYRELAKLLARQENFSYAVALIAKIETPDTKAMTIRGIGMAAAEVSSDSERLAQLFTELHRQATLITHPPSHAIALTYIAMSQAFAGDDAGAMTTAKMMENGALRNKAFAESAEIQAERGDYEAARTSIAEIEDPAFQDKALRTISKILADRDYYDSALKAAMTVKNPYQKAQSLLYLAEQKFSPKETTPQ